MAWTKLFATLELVEYILLGLIPPRILPTLYLSEVETVLLKTNLTLFPLDHLQKGYIFGKLRNIVRIEMSDSIVLGTDHVMRPVLLLCHHSVEATFAVCVSASRK